MTPNRKNILKGTGKGLAGLVIALSQIIPNTAYPDYKTDNVDEQNVFFGTANTQCPELRVINYQKLLNSTSEAEEAKNVEPGTAKYDLLLGKANKKVQSWIPKYAQDNSIDQIVEYGAIDKFKVLPEEYKNLETRRVLVDLDVTDDIINQYSD